MTNPAAERLDVSPGERLLQFEQPLTERMRTFLRVEFLHRQARYHADDPTDLGARAAVASLLEILTILGRAEVRSEVSKELEKQSAALGRYRTQPGVDSMRLQGLIDNVNALRSQLAEAGPQHVGPLKECDFLTNIKHRSTIPGGTCVFDLPDYHYWLHLPGAEREEQLAEWMSKLKPICAAVEKVLWLTREANEPVEKTAGAGFYQHTLAKNEQANLVRVLVPSRSGFFPEISASQHRFNVRFVQWRGVHSRPVQVQEDVRFLLALC